MGESPSAKLSRGIAGLLLAAACAGVWSAAPARAQDGGAAAATEAEAPEFRAESIGSFAGAFLAARTADINSDTQAAIDYYSRALAFDRDNDDLKQLLMLAYFSNGDFDEGLKLANALKDDTSIERVTDLALAIDAFRKREYRVVDTLLERDGTNELDDLLNGLLEAWAEQGRGDTDAALAIVDELLGPQWYAPIVNFHGGSIAAAGGKRSEARQRFTAVVTDQSAGSAAPETYMHAVMALAGIEARAGNMQTARDVIATGEAFSASYAPLAALREKVEAGAEVPLQISTAQEGAAAVLNTIASTLNRGGAEQILAFYLQLSRALDPSNAWTLVLLGQLAEATGQPERAIDFYERVPEDAPMRRVAQLQLGLNLADLDRMDEAKAHLRALIEADPSDLRSYEAYGRVLSVNEDYQAMAENFETAIAQIEGTPDRGDWNVFYQLGIAYERLKEWEKAEPNFLKALELFPEQPQVLNYLGYSWVDMDMHLERGMEMIEKAVELRPNDGYIVDSLGWAHYRLGQYPQAVTHLEEAVELRPGDPTINDHLGDAYWRVGRRLEAVFQWRRVLDLDPEEEQIAEIRDKIDNGLTKDSAPATAQGEEERSGERPPAVSPDERSELHGAGSDGTEFAGSR